MDEKELVITVCIGNGLAESKAQIVSLLQLALDEIKHASFEAILAEDGSKLVLTDGGPKIAEWWVQNVYNGH